MRRIKINHQPTTYHVISRVVAGERILEERDREVLRKQMRQMAAFCGVEIRTYCILSNHFHLLVRVPPKRELEDADLVRRYAVLYGEEKAGVLGENLKSEGLRDGIRKSLFKRMHDLSFFVKELKLRFTLYYNHNHKRFGTLWAEKFKSLVVENDEYAIKMVAAYIDLNPVRAGLCEDPKDYRFCGYAEAVGGGKAARDGLLGIVSARKWADCARGYRMVLFGTGVMSDRSKEGGIDPAVSRRVLAEGGKLPIWELARCRVRYFSDGITLGSPGFIAHFRREFSDCLAKERPGKPPVAPVEDESLCFARRKRSMSGDETM